MSFRVDVLEPINEKRLFKFFSHVKNLDLNIFNKHIGCTRCIDFFYKADALK